MALQERYFSQDMQPETLCQPPRDYIPSGAYTSGNGRPDVFSIRRGHLCPICGSGADDKRGHGTRCKMGFLSADRRYAHCGNRNYAGSLPPDRNGNTYAHRLDGPCACGETHDGEALRTAAVMPRARRLYTTIAHTLADGAARSVEWQYRAADGSYVYSVVRYDHPKTGEKTYRPWQPVGQDWAMDEDGLTRVLYRLPELLAADPFTPVWIVEGEKCADALAALGLVATTNAGGADKWRDDYSAHLCGRQCIILADADAAGRRHALTVAKSLAGGALTVRVLELEGAPDVFDWLADGHTLDELRTLAAQTEIITASSPSALNSIPALQDGPIVETLKMEIASLRDRLQIAETSLANLRRRQAMAERIMALPKEKLTPPLKPAAIAVHNVLSQPRARNEQGMEQVYRAEIARQCGVSDKTAGAYLRDLANAGVIQRDVKKWFDRSEIYISEGPLFDQPEAIEAPERANTWGGKRKCCSACGSTNLEVRVICRDCGTVLSADDVNKPEQEQEAPQDNTPPENIP